MIPTKLLSELRTARKAKVEEVTARMKVWQADRQKVMAALKAGKGETVSELATATGLSPSTAVRHLLAMRKSNLISETGVKGDEYIYRLIGGKGGR